MGRLSRLIGSHRTGGLPAPVQKAEHTQLMKIPGFSHSSDDSRDTRAPRDARDRPARSFRHSGADDTVTNGMKIAGAWGWRILVVAACLAALHLPDRDAGRDRHPVLDRAADLGAAAAGRHGARAPPRGRSGSPSSSRCSVAIVIFGGLDPARRLCRCEPGCPRSRRSRSIVVRVGAGVPRRAAVQPDHAATTSRTSTRPPRPSKTAASRSSRVPPQSDSAVSHFVADGLLTIFATIFMMIDGDGVWKWVVRLFPRRARRRDRRRRPVRLAHAHHVRARADLRRGGRRSRCRPVRVLPRAAAGRADRRPGLPGVVHPGRRCHRLRRLRRASSRWSSSARSRR